MYLQVPMAMGILLGQAVLVVEHVDVKRAVGTVADECALARGGKRVHETIDGPIVVLAPGMAERRQVQRQGWKAKVKVKVSETETETGNRV